MSWDSYGAAVVRSIPFAFSLLDSIVMALYTPAAIGCKVSPKLEASFIATYKSQYQFLVRYILRLSLPIQNLHKPRHHSDLEIFYIRLAGRVS